MIEDKLIDEEIELVEKADVWYFHGIKSYTKKEQREAFNKAIEIWSRHFDSKLQLVLLESNAFKRLGLLENLLLECQDDLIENEKVDFVEDVGSFWGITSTRPYMRIKYSILENLLELDYKAQAIVVGEELVVLSKSDNMGIRGLLYDLYNKEELVFRMGNLYTIMEFYEPSIMFPYLGYLIDHNFIDKAIEVINGIAIDNDYVLYIIQEDYHKAIKIGKDIFDDNSCEDLNYEQRYAFKAIYEKRNDINLKLMSEFLNYVFSKEDKSLLN